MRRPSQPDPYNGFKDDVQRRLALNTKERRIAVVAIAIALSGAHMDWMETIRWLINLFH